MKDNHRLLLSKAVIAVCCCLCLSFGAILVMVYQSSKTDPIAQVDAILILGAGLDGDKPRAVLQERLETSLYYLYNNETCLVVVSGGQGPDETITEAEAMHRFLAASGIEGRRILKESQSTSTRENIANSAAIIWPLSHNSRPEVAIVTSGFHLFRAKQIAREYGLKPYGIAAKTPKGQLPRYLFREIFAIINDLVLHQK